MTAAVLAWMPVRRGTPVVAEDRNEMPDEPGMAEAVATMAAEENSKAKGPFLNKYFKAVIKGKFSDLHLKADCPPTVRVKGVSGGRTKGALRPLTGGPLSGEQIFDGVMEGLQPKQRTLFEEKGSIDVAHDVGEPGNADRFRANAFMQRGKLSL